MAYPRPVYWHQGMFLVPQVLQHVQQSAEEMVRATRKSITPFPEGLLECRINEAELERGKLSFTSLQAVMPDGLVVDSPGAAEVAPRDVGPLFEGESLRFFLVTPPWSEDGRNLARGANEQRLYRSQPHALVDSFTGEKKDVPLLTVQAEVLVEKEIPARCQRIGLVQIRRSGKGGTGGFEVDPRYAPPCIRVRAWRWLREWSEGIAAEAGARRNKQHLSIFGRDKTGAIDMKALVGLMKLRTLGRGCARLHALVQSPTLTPFEYYAALMEVVNELQTHSGAKADHTAARPDYEHNDVMKCLEELARRFEALSRPDGMPTVLRQAFQREGVWWRCKLPPEFTRERTWFLELRSGIGDEGIRTRVADRGKFKIMPPVVRTDQLRRNQFGWRVQPDPRPQGLPSPDAGVMYFRFDRDGTEEWVRQSTDGEREVCIEWTDREHPFDFDASMVVVLPAE